MTRDPERLQHHRIEIREYPDGVGMSVVPPFNVFEVDRILKHSGITEEVHRIFASGSNKMGHGDDASTWGLQAHGEDAKVTAKATVVRVGQEIRRLMESMDAAIDIEVVA